MNGGIALNYSGSSGRNALWGTSSRGHKCIIRFLLENGNCEIIPDCEGATLIEIAATDGHWNADDGFIMHGPTIRTDRATYPRTSNMNHQNLAF